MHTAERFLQLMTESNYLKLPQSFGAFQPFNQLQILKNKTMYMFNG